MKYKLSPEFYNKRTTDLAQALLGMNLIHNSPEGKTSGKIVETETYLFKDDPACHAHRGIRKRNEVMFGRPGHAHVYLCYGKYALFNIVSGAEGIGEAVLIRALEPVTGIELMQKRRATKLITSLTNGPGKLVLAMGIGMSHNGESLQGNKIYLQGDKSSDDQDFKIVTTTRIGISAAQDLKLRYYIKGNKFVSRV